MTWANVLRTSNGKKIEFELPPHDKDSEALFEYGAEHDSPANVINYHIQGNPMSNKGMLCIDHLAKLY